MWLTSNRPTPVRTAMCSAMRAPPGPGYSTGMSQPPKSTILALRARCVALRAVFFSCGAMAGVVMIVPLDECGGTLLTIGTAHPRVKPPAVGQTTSGGGRRRRRGKLHADRIAIENERLGECNIFAES